MGLSNQGDYGLEHAAERSEITGGPEAVLVQMNKKDTIEALKLNGEFFINFFLGAELEYDVPQFHKDCWSLLTNVSVEKIALALPRGHAKTTLAKLSVVWYLLFTDFRFIVYLSNTHAVASEACKDIFTFLSSPNFIALFGSVETEVEQDQKGFFKFWITLPHVLDERGRPLRKFCILKSLGAGQQVRGLNIDNERPELAVADDMEDDDNTATEALLKKLKSWFYGPFQKALSRKRKKLLYLGNMITNRGLLYFFVEKSDSWFSMRYGCLLSNGQPLWPDLWPLEALIEDFLEYKNAGMIGKWFAEMMNIPMSDSAPLIKSDEIQYRPAILPEQALYSFITVDPAISMQNWADNTGIAVHSSVEAVWQIAEGLAMKLEPNQMFQVIMELCRKWKTRVVGIESGSYQKAYKFLFEVFMIQEQFEFTIVEVPHANRSKTERLAIFASFLRTGKYTLSDGDFVITEQLLRYDPTKKENDDDLIDACAMGPVMIEGYLDYILEEYAYNNAEFTIRANGAIQAN